MKLENQVAIVTGAAQGIGKVISLVFSEEGASIALVDLMKPKLEEAAREIKQKGGKAITIVADLTD